MPLSRLIYVSEAQIDPAEGSLFSQLAGIMKASIRNNQASGVTGALVYDDAWFLQALEGERRAVWRTFERINSDERHANCLLIAMSEVGERVFDNWWMGLATRDADTAAAFRPYLRGGMLHPPEMSAEEILGLMRELAKHSLRRQMRNAA